MQEQAMTNLLIRDAVEADLVAIRDIYNHAVEHTTAIWNDVLIDVDNRRVWLELRRAKGFPVLVAEVDGRVAGYASYGDWRAFDGYRHTVEHSVYVDKDSRGAGLGKALMLALIERARTADLHVMIAAIEAGNVASIALHERLGFRLVGIHREVGQKFGRWLDLAAMELKL
jgi:phosphinothricin acetyltransferase